MIIPFNQVTPCVRGDPLYSPLHVVASEVIVHSVSDSPYKFNATVLILTTHPNVTAVSIA